MASTDLAFSLIGICHTLSSNPPPLDVHNLTPNCFAARAPPAATLQRPRKSHDEVSPSHPSPRETALWVTYGCPGCMGTAQDSGLRDHLDALLALMGEHHDQSAGRAREMETSNTTQLHPCEQYCSRGCSREARRPPRRES